MLNLVLTGLLAVLGSLPFSRGQCPNEVYNYNTDLRTMTSNETWIMVPVNASLLQSILNSYYSPSGTVELAPVPSSDTSLFPYGFPAGYHPLLVSAGYTDNIYMSAAQIDGALLGGGIYATYLRLSTSASGTILSASLSDYLNGPNNDYIAGIVPIAAANLFEGEPLRLGQFTPSDAAYQVNSGDVLSNSVAWADAPNPVSGPGVYPQAITMTYFQRGQYNATTAKLFLEMLNQPIILSTVNGALNVVTGQCQRNQYYFKNATSAMTPVFGNVTFGPAADGIVEGMLQSSGSSGQYNGFEGFMGCGQNVGNNPQPCDEAAKTVDTSALSNSN